MRALAVVAVLIGVFLVGIGSPLEPVGIWAMNSAKHASSPISEIIFIQDRPSEMERQNGRCEHLETCVPSNRIWNDIIAFQNATAGNLDSSKIVVASGKRIANCASLCWPFSKNPTLYNYSFGASRINQGIKDFLDTVFGNERNVAQDYSRAMHSKELQTLDLLLLQLNVSLRSADGELSASRFRLFSREFDEQICDPSKDRCSDGGNKSATGIESFYDLPQEDQSKIVAAALGFICFFCVCAYLARDIEKK